MEKKTLSTHAQLDDKITTTSNITLIGKTSAKAYIKINTSLTSPPQKKTEQRFQSAPSASSLSLYTLQKEYVTVFRGI
jgi:hypothetical protein